MFPDIRKSSQPRDFKLLNKKAAMDGVVTAKQNWQYQQQNDVRVNSHIGLHKFKKARELSLPQEGFTYGRANRPQTPIDGIINNQFGENSA